MTHTFKIGQVVLYRNEWNHANNGRPFVVLEIDSFRGIRLCPLTSSPSVELEANTAPLMPRYGGLKRVSWVGAVDFMRSVSNLFWVKPILIGPVVCSLTQQELTAVQLSAVTQLKRLQAKVLTCRTVS